MTLNHATEFLFCRFEFERSCLGRFFRGPFELHHQVWRERSTSATI